MSVTVYKVRMYIIARDEMTISRRMATVQGAHMMGGDIVDGTAVEIEDSQLEDGMQWTARGFDPHAATGFQQRVRP